VPHQTDELASDGISDFKPVSTRERVRKARAYIKVRANSTLIDLFAAVKTNMSSRSTTTIDFVTCPHKH
jgi:hypothetical protein